MQQKTINGALAVLVVVALVVAVYGVFAPQPPEPVPVVKPQGITNFDSLSLENDLVVSGATTLTGATTQTGALTLAGLLYPSFADLTVTDGYTLTAAYTTYALDSAGAVTITLAATASEGQPLILIGDDANNIVINDTNVRTSTGAALTIGQYDVVMFVFQDSEWIELLLLADS